MNINTKTPDLCSNIFTLSYVPTSQEIEEEFTYIEKIRVARTVMCLVITTVILAFGSYYLVPTMSLSISTIITYCIASTFIYKRVAGKRMEELEADKVSLSYIAPEKEYPAENVVTAHSIFYAAALHEKTKEYVAKVGEQKRQYTYGELWMFQRLLGGKYSL